MSRRKEVVETYFEGFRRSDHEQILACLTDDVVWDLPGYTHLEGKEAFDREIEHPDFVGSPTLTVDRLVEEGDTLIAIGEGEGTHTSGQRHRFAFCTVLTFTSDRIRRVESYVVPLK
jgi:uncharacterized protein